MRSVVTLTSLALLTAAPQLVWAADERSGEVVVTGTRTPEQVQRASVKTDVVTREEAERRGATNVAEALSSQPGVVVNPGAYGSIGGASAIQIQGFDKERVLILEDGERVIGDVGGAIDLSSLPLSDLSRMEIVAGPQSALYGASAIGGVVNLISAPPQDMGYSGRVRLEGRYPLGTMAQLSSAYRAGDSWAQFDGSLFWQEGIKRLPGLPDLAVPEVMRRNVGVKAGTKLGGRSELKAKVRYISTNEDGLESQIVPGLDRRYIVELPDQNNRLAMQLQSTHDLGGGSGLRMSVSRQVFSGTSDKRYQGAIAHELRDRSYSMQSAESTATIADGPRTWVFGGRAEVERFDQELLKVTTNNGDVVETRSTEVPVTEQAAGALYAQLAWKFGSHVTVLPGVRQEMHTRFRGATAPRIAIAIRPNTQWTIRASAGRGYRTPSAKELGFIFDHSFYGYRVDGNGDLMPEHSWGGSVDASYTITSDITTRAAVFGNAISDMIDIDVANGVPMPGGVVSYKYRNLGRARTAGGQLAIAMRANSVLRTELSYDYLYTRDLESDRPLGGRPPHIVTASLLAKLPLQIEGVARFRFASDAFVDTTTRSPGYSSIDARLSRPLWRRASGYVGALNLFDVRQEPGRVGDLRPIQGRTFYLGLTAEFPTEDDS